MLLKTPQLLSIGTDNGEESAEAERQQHLVRAAALLARGAPVAVPTETVYGLAADATQPLAVARLYEMKGRPAFNPLILHCTDLAHALELGVFDETALFLATTFWPGPLTLVVPKRSGSAVADIAVAGLDSVALRVTGHFAMRALARHLGRPLAAPSANKSGSLSPTTAAAVSEQFGGELDLILDAGPSSVGLESTVVACLGSHPQILRQGGLTCEEINAALGTRALLATGESAAKGAGQVRAPGATLNHYAPRTPLRINALHIEPGEAALLFGPQSLEGLNQASAVRNLSLQGDLKEAAAHLFQMLRELDQVGAKMIAAAAIPNHHLGTAINDRLTRACAATHLSR